MSTVTESPPLQEEAEGFHITDQTPDHQIAEWLHTITVKHFSEDPDYASHLKQAKIALANLKRIAKQKGILSGPSEDEVPPSNSPKTK